MEQTNKVIEEEAKAKPNTQQDTETKLTKAEMKEVTDINTQFYTLLNRTKQWMY